MRILHPYIGSLHAQVEAPTCGGVDIRINFGSLVDSIDPSSNRVAA
jgi:hypothetical protein